MNKSKKIKLERKIFFEKLKNLKKVLISQIVMIILKQFNFSQFQNNFSLDYKETNLILITMKII